MRYELRNGGQPCVRRPDRNTTHKGALSWLHRRICSDSANAQKTVTYTKICIIYLIVNLECRRYTERIILNVILGKHGMRVCNGLNWRATVFWVYKLANSFKILGNSKYPRRITSNSLGYCREYKGYGCNTDRPISCLFPYLYCPNSRHFLLYHKTKIYNTKHLVHCALKSCLTRTGVTSC